MEKIYNFAKKDFFIFASTYVAIIFLVLLCFFPVCRAFERSEQLRKYVITPPVC